MNDDVEGNTTNNSKT